MAGGDMADLMAHHAREFRLAVHVGEDAAGEIDEAARDREGIHDRVVDDLEIPGEFRALGDARHREADVRDIALQRFVLVEPHAGRDLGGILLAHRDFLGFADQHELALSGHRVRRAPRELDRAQGRGGDGFHGRRDPIDRGSNRAQSWKTSGASEGHQANQANHTNEASRGHRPRRPNVYPSGRPCREYPIDRRASAAR